MAQEFDHLGLLETLCRNGRGDTPAVVASDVVELVGQAERHPVDRLVPMPVSAATVGAVEISAAPRAPEAAAIRNPAAPVGDVSAGTSGAGDT